MKHFDSVAFGKLLEQMTQLTDALEKQSSFEVAWLPSIAAISAALVALLVGCLSNSSAKEQIKTLRENAEAQVKSAEAIAKSQLENAKEITIAEIKANLVAASRKEWIENLRLRIAELFKLTNKIHGGVGVNRADFDELWRISVYIELLLNPEEESHLEFLLKQSKFVNFCHNNDTDIEKWVDLKRDYIAAAKIVLKTEWNKVKSLN